MNAKIAFISCGRDSQFARVIRKGQADVVYSLTVEGRFYTVRNISSGTIATESLTAASVTADFLNFCKGYCGKFTVVY
jgi:hypothetical protein